MTPPNSPPRSFTPPRVYLHERPVPIRNPTPPPRPRNDVIVTLQQGRRVVELRQEERSRRSTHQSQPPRRITSQRRVEPRRRTRRESNHPYSGRLTDAFRVFTQTYSSPICFNCGREGHIRVNCREETLRCQCRMCGREGSHFGVCNNCRFPRKK